MIADGEKSNYLAEKSKSKLLHGITAKHNDGSYCMSCLHSFRTKNKHKSHENVCKNHDYCHIEMRHITKYCSLIKIKNI